MVTIKVSHLLLIQKLAWSFHRTTGMDWDELFAQASLFYCQACLVYERREGVKKITFIYKFIQNELITFLNKEFRYSKHHIHDDSLDYPVQQTAFFELFDALSPESKQIVEMILSNPVEYAKLPGKMARGLVIQNLKNQKNWTYARAWKGLRTIRLELMKL